MKPVDFWQLTFAEFFPLYETVVGDQYEPMTKEDLADLEAEWTGAKVGNS
jgi:hypothetical protein